MIILKICNRIIEYSFYALFLFVPLVLANDTFELFEFNKMWLTFGITLIIGASWFIKMALQKKIIIQRTPLDIPILIFLTSQFISTIFSWDVHVSFWGYYSRFNGGLLSIVTYIFLYYAFVSNFSKRGVARLEGVPSSARRDPPLAETEDIGWDEGATGPRAIMVVKRLLFISLISGAIVALWGLPSHFGYDPTCFLFRGNFDVSCWTDDFQPRARIFSTLGQPAWLAAYLAILIPITTIMFIKFIKNLPLSIFYLLLSALFYIDLLYTQARSGIIAIWSSIALFFAIYLRIERKAIIKPLVVLLVFISITFFVGTPFNQLHKFTLDGLREQFIKNKLEAPKTTIEKEVQPPPVVHVGELGGTDSGKIRSIVWKGALEIWKNNPVFGTGVETFAYAYYKYKLPSHNLTSEWNFLYNKAHNEYLNYLATTGIFGLGSYLAMIILFLVLCIKYYVSSIKKGIHNTYYILLNTGLLASYISILVTNFFGFSVVIINIYLFMIPAFVFVLSGTIKPEKVFLFPTNKTTSNKISAMQWVAILILTLATLYLIQTLIRSWNADKNYAYGYNLDRAGDYINAAAYLHKAVQQRNEPVFKDELAVNDAILAVSYINQQDPNADKDKAIAKATELAKEAISISDELTTNYENNVVFWKSRVRILYSLSQVDARYLSKALQAIQKTSELAPTDASIAYNLGILYGQNNDLQKGLEAMEYTVKLKPDYKDGRYALGLFYHQAAIDEKGSVVNEEFQKEAIAEMQYILTHLSPKDTAAQEALKSWEKK